MSLSTCTHHAQSLTILSPVDLQQFQKNEAEMIFPDSSFSQTSEITQERAQVFFRHIEETLPTQDANKSSLQTLIERISQLPKTEENHIAEITQAFFKQRGYISRLFSQESWEEWTENRTAFGKVAFLLRDCIESSRSLSHFTQRLDERVIQQANQEAIALLQKLDHRHATVFQPKKCITGLLGGTVGSLLTKNPLPLFLGLSACLPQAYAQQKVGVEFQVNTYTNGSQEYPSVASFSNGDFVVTWQSDAQDGSLYGVYGQLFDANGDRIGNEFQINTYSTYVQDDPSVASLNNGNFVVTWDSDVDGRSMFGIIGQLFGASGNKIGNEFQVNTYTPYSQVFPAGTKVNTDHFVVIWQSEGQDGSGYGIYGQLFRNNSSRIGDEFQVNTHTPDEQAYPAVTDFRNGNFVVTWQSKNQDGDGWGIFGQLFYGNATRIGREFLVNTNITDSQEFPSITSLSNGNFVVTWENISQNNSSHRVYGQLFDGMGTKTGNAFQANTYSNFSRFPSITSLENDYFIITWHSKKGQEDDSWEVFGQLFDENITKIGEEFLINTYITNIQGVSSVAWLQKRNFIVAWQSKGQDGSDWGIYAQIFTMPHCNTIQQDSQTFSQRNIISEHNFLFAKNWKAVAAIIGSCAGVTLIGVAAYLAIQRRVKSSIDQHKKLRKGLMSNQSPELRLRHQRSPSPIRRPRHYDVELASLSESPSASLFPPPVKSSKASSSRSSASLSREELQTLLSNAHLTPKKLTELHRSLEALPFPPEQISSCITLVKDWEDELTSVAQREQVSRSKKAEQKELFNHPNSSVGDYYEVLWAHISDTILACKTMHSGLTPKSFINKFDTAHQAMDIMSRVLQRTGDILGGEIPYVGGGAHFLSFILDLLSGSVKERAVENLSQLVREIGDIDTLAEEVACLLTKAKMRQLETMADGSSKISWADRLKTRLQTYGASECTTEAKKLAIQDVMIIIKAVAKDRAGNFDEPDLVDKLVRCVLPEFLRPPVALSGSKTRSEASSSASLSLEEYRKMSEKIESLVEEVSNLKKELSRKEKPSDSKMQRTSSEERLKKIEKALEALIKTLDVTVGAHLLIKSSSHSPGKRGEESMHRDLENIDQRLRTLEIMIAQLIESLGANFHSLIDSPSPAREEKLDELLKRESDEESLL